VYKEERLASPNKASREEKFEQNFRSEVCRKYAIRFAPLCSKSSLFKPNKNCFRAGLG
jgi:hypothetical protein